MKKIGIFIMSTILVTLVATPYTSFGLSEKEIKEKEEALYRELERIEQEKAEVQIDLNETRAEGQTIQRDINILTGEIKEAELNIKQKNITIGSLLDSISDKEATIEELSERLEQGRFTLAEVLRETYYKEDVSIAEFMLSDKELSEIFIDVDDLFAVKQKLQQVFDQVRETKHLTQEQKEQLHVKKDQEIVEKSQVEAEKQKVERKEDEKQYLLSLNKAEEAEKAAILAQKEAQAQAIRDALFQLRDTAGISFGEAVVFAEQAGKATGVRPAFILAILKQESDLGKNVGTCNRAGDPASKKWDQIMPGPNDNSWRDDQTIFLALMKQLGRNPDSTPLSCPAPGGWGGAMGPSQFIPTTWQSYAGRIANAVGAKIADPWIPRHAFTATALYVADLGASRGTYDAEREAALRYYAGSNWSLPQNAFYGNGVMSHASNFQDQIDFLEEVDNQ